MQRSTELRELLRSKIKGVGEVLAIENKECEDSLNFDFYTRGSRWSADS
jgi:hypothetical protein